jgi:GNAT superfamily N-acetyltransferase
MAQGPAAIDPVVMRPAPLRVVIADAADEPGNGLLLAMEREITHLYADRDGSIHRVPATPADMGPPHGRFIVVYDGERAIGCGGLKRIADGTCEIKRMYLVPDERGQGLSRPLLEALELEARRLGYRRARLDTGDRQPSAKRLYESAGYRQIRDYNGNTLARFWFEKELEP